jgi:hypothetical protein
MNILFTDEVGLNPTIQNTDWSMGLLSIMF